MMINIYLIPYAGADVSCFMILKEKLQNKFGARAKIIPIELKGHGKRRKEPLYGDMNEVVADVMRQINYDNGSVILYGHCIGGIIAYAVYLKSREVGRTNVKSVFLGSSIINKSAADGFESYISSYVEENIRLLFPNLPKGMLRQLSEYKQEIVQQEYNIVMEYLLDNPIVPDGKQFLIFGKNDQLVDPVTIVNDYNELSKLEIYTVNGGHFFLEESSGELAEIIGKKVKGMEM